MSRISKLVKPNVWLILLLVFFLVNVGVSVPDPDLHLDDFPATTSFVIKTDGSEYWAVADTGDIAYSSTNASYVFDSVYDAMSNGGFVVVREGSYQIDYKVSIEYDGISTIGEGSVVEDVGTRLIFGTNGKFSLESTDHLNDVSFQDLKFDGGNVATRAITSEDMTSGKRVRDLDIEDCRFENWLANGVIPLNIKNGELVSIKRNDFAYTNATWIRFYDDSYYSGNNFIENNAFYLGWGTVGGTAIQIDQIDSIEYFVNLRSYQNHYFGTNANQAISTGIVLNASGGLIMGVQSKGDRTENCELLNTYAGVNQYIRAVSVTNGHISTGNYPNSVLIDLVNGTRDAKITDNYFARGADVSVIGVRDNGTSGSYYSNEVRSNTFYWFSGSGVAIDAGTYTKISDNQGYNPVGYISSPVSGTVLVDSGSGSINNNTMYYCYNSPKTIYLQDGTSFDVKVNGELVFDDVLQAQVYLVAGDTFEVEWSSTLDVLKVMAH